MKPKRRSAIFRFFVGNDVRRWLLVSTLFKKPAADRVQFNTLYKFYSKQNNTAVEAVPTPGCAAVKTYCNENINNDDSFLFQ